MKTAKIDLDELKRLKVENFKDRLDFIKRYADWVKRTPNKKWSAEQKKIVG